MRSKSLTSLERYSEGITLADSWMSQPEFWTLPLKHWAALSEQIFSICEYSLFLKKKALLTAEVQACHKHLQVQEQNKK